MRKSLFSLAPVSVSVHGGDRQQEVALARAIRERGGGRCLIRGPGILAGS